MLTFESGVQSVNAAAADVSSVIEDKLDACLPERPELHCDKWVSKSSYTKSQKQKANHRMEQVMVIIGTSHKDLV